MNGLATDQVLAGEGRFFDHVALESAQKPTSATTPTSGRRYMDGSKRTAVFFMLVSSSGLEVLDRERLRVLVRPGRVEHDTVEQLLGFVVEAAVLDADLLHRRLVDVVAHDLFGDALVIRRAGHHP